MAREWEVPPQADHLDYLNNPFITPGGEAEHRYWAREAWLFRPEEIKDFECRNGYLRRYSDPETRIYLREELLLRNTHTGLLDEYETQ